MGAGASTPTETEVDMTNPFPGYNWGYTIQSSIYLPHGAKGEQLRSTLDAMEIPFIDWEAARSYFLNPASASLCRGRFVTQSFIEQDKRFFLLIYRDGIVYGALSFDYSLIEPKEFFISEVCVAAVDELKGAGRKLMAIVERIAIALDIPTIKLIVGTTGKGARNWALFKWYADQGYTYMNPKNAAVKSLEYPWVSKSLASGSLGRGGRRRKLRKTRRLAAQRYRAGTRSKNSYS
jgi:hypothetical protein